MSDELKYALSELNIEKNLAPECMRITEEAAISCARLMGKGDRNEADQLATEAMRKTMDDIEFKGRIVIGEGERDEAPMLYIGEEVGRFSSKFSLEERRAVMEVDIAVDPLEGTNLVATGQSNAITVLALSETGGLMHAPDTYLDKLCVGPTSAGQVSIEQSPTQNLKCIAKALKRDISDLTVVILDRERHMDLIEEVRTAGARIKLIGDGDLSAAISCAIRGTNIHAVMGAGGAPEGVITAAAMKCLGGEIQAKFRFRNDEEKERAKRMGHENLDKVLYTNDLAPGENIVFACTGVTTGDLLSGIKYFGGGARTHSLVMSYKHRIFRLVDTVHMLDKSKQPPIRL